MTIDSAFALGFDHVALCAGAGRPTVIPMPNNLAPGVRQASDFLMALQLTGAAKTDSIANLTVRLPVVVIGGGLTAIDTATESLAYYPVQVEKFLSRYETLVAERGEEAVRGRMERGRARGRRRIHRPWPRDPRRARGRPPRGPRAATGRTDRQLGRGDDRLSPPPGRRAELHPQPRGGGKGDGGGHPLCRIADPGRGRGRSVRPGSGVAADPARPQEVGGTGPSPIRAGRGGRAAGAHDPGRRRDPAQHRARPRGPRECRARRPLFPRARRGRQPGRAGAGREARGRAGADASARGRPRGQLFRRSASELFGQRRQGDGRRHAGLSGGQPHAGAAAAFGPVAGRACGRGSTTNCARGCTRSSG